MRIGVSSSRIQGVQDTLLRHRTKLAEAEALLLALQRGKSDPRITSTKQIKAFIDRQDLEIRKLETALLAAIEGNVSRGVQQDLEDQLRRARDELVLAEERLDERLRHKGKAPRPRRARGTRRTNGAASTCANGGSSGACTSFGCRTGHQCGKQSGSPCVFNNVGWSDLFDGRYPTPKRHNSSNWSFCNNYVRKTRCSCKR